MEKTNTPTRELALTLLDYPLVEGRRHADLPVALQSAFDVMRDHLSTRIGREGYRALLTRAVALASDELPWLVSIRVTKDAKVDGFAEVAAKQTHQAALDGATAVIDKFIQMLEIFVGRDLAFRLLSTAKPVVSRIGDTRSKETYNG